MTEEKPSPPPPAPLTETQVRALLEESCDIVSLLDGQGRLLFNSSATERINGFKPAELFGVDTFDYMHPDDRAAVAEAFGRMLTTPGGTVTVQYRYKNRAGDWQWMEAIARNQLDNPEVRGVVANTRDISDRKRLEAEQKKHVEQLFHAQQLDSLGTLAGGVAHDFNNLLSVVLGEATLLSASSTPEDAREAAAAIAEAATRAAALTQTLLACAGKARFTRAPLSLPTLLSAMEADLRAWIPQGSRLIVEVDPTTPLIDAAEERLRQVLGNLVRNGAEALTAAGEVTVRVGHEELDEATLTGCTLREGLAPGRAAFIEVSDTGHGLSDEARARLFEPYFTTRAFGRGLGMAAVAGIVRGFRGAVNVTSQPGVGTRVKVWFASATPAVTAAPAQARPAPFRGHGLALVVDDEPQTARVAARMLEAFGFTTELAIDGQDALDRFGARLGELKLVLLDVVMPRLDGAQTFERLRALRPDLPVIFYSGYDAGAVERPLEQPKTRFLQKPFELAAFDACLRGLLSAE